MHIIDSWQETPAPVDLGVILVDLRRDKDNGRQSKTEGERSDERVRGEVELLQSDSVSAGVLQRGGQ